MQKYNNNISSYHFYCFMKVTSNLGNTFFITSAACGLLTFPSNEKLAGWIYSYSLFILYLPDGKSILNCLTNILISSSLKDSILFCCFSFASSSSFCFLFFSNALRALSLGSSKSSLITMDSTKRLKMISQIQRGSHHKIYLKCSGTASMRPPFWFFFLLIIIYIYKIFLYLDNISKHVCCTLSVKFTAIGVQ